MNEGRYYHDLVSLTDRERVADVIREVTEGSRGALEYLMVTPDAGSSQTRCRSTGEQIMVWWRCWSLVT